jgi:hypothetical protein
MTTSIGPYPKFKAFYPGTGNPLVGGKLYTYQAGTVSTPTTTYKNSGGSSVNTNPIILDSNGECDLWLPGYVKLVLQDALGNQLWSEDNVSSQYFQTLTQSPWVAQNLANLTYSNATTFTCSGNQTVILPVGMRIEATVAAGLITGTIANSTFANSTTSIKTTWDGSSNLDSGLSQVATAITTTTTPTPNLIPQWDANSALSANQFISTIPTGNAPFIVASTSLVANLNAATCANAALLGGYTATTVVSAHTYSQNEVSSNRAVNTTYQNLLTYPLWVTASVYMNINNGGNINVLVDSNAVPTTTLVQASSNVSTQIIPITFLVPAGYYYKIGASNAANLFISLWAEWH